MVARLANKELERMWKDVGSEVITAVVMGYILWRIMPCSPLKFNRRFGGIFRLNIQRRKISQARK
jgi:hypothetical protein